MADDRSDRERAFKHLRELGPLLAADAATLLASHPDGELGGLILEKGTAEYKKYRHLIQQSSGVEVVPDCLAGVVELAIVATLIAEGPPALAEWFADVLRGDLDRIPVLVYAKTGMQAAAVPLPPAPAAPTAEG